MKYPFTFTNGKHSSTNSGRFLTALAITTSYESRFASAYSSDLVWTVLIPFRFSFFIKLFKNVIFLLFESNKVTSILGKNIFNITPGKPAPVPTSIRLFTLLKS
jgi:hypothetical protein